MIRMRKMLIFAALLAMVAGSAVSATAQDVRVSAGPTDVDFQPSGTYERLVLTVSAPDGCVVRQEVKAGAAASFSIFDEDGQSHGDGSYTWELTIEPPIDKATRQALAEARGGDREKKVIEELRRAGKLPQQPLVQSGSFAVVNGTIVIAGDEEPRPKPRLSASGATGGTERVAGSLERVGAADQVIPDDLIVQQSLCVGFDCVNNESFGFDTIRLKENNTRIKFEDTSVGTFPSNDWQLTANDSASGGSNKFSIEDITGAKVPFTVTAGASTNSIFVDSTGRVGFRTSTPVLDLHVATSNTPAVRLEQNSSGGFTAQTWDIAGNEANFFVRDVTGGSRLPFRIRPGAPTSSIDIAADGDVGMGTASPDSDLHIVNATAPAAQRTLLHLENNGGVELSLEDQSAAGGAGVTWVWQNVNAEVRITDQGDAINELVLTQAGNMTIAGTLFQGSSRSIKERFGPVDSRDVLRRVVGLPITSWNYKAAPGVRHVGPMAEDFFEAFAVGQDDKSISVTDGAGVALAAIQGLHQELTARDSEIAALRARLEELASMLEQLKAAP